MGDGVFFGGKRTLGQGGGGWVIKGGDKKGESFFPQSCFWGGLYCLGGGGVCNQVGFPCSLFLFSDGMW